MITLRTGPAFQEPRTLAEQLEASLWLHRETPELEAARERVHVSLEMMLLERDEK